MMRCTNLLTYSYRASLLFDQCPVVLLGGRGKVLIMKVWQQESNAWPLVANPLYNRALLLANPLNSSEMTIIMMSEYTDNPWVGN